MSKKYTLYKKCLLMFTMISLIFIFYNNVYATPIYDAYAHGTLTVVDIFGGDLDTHIWVDGRISRDENIETGGGNATTSSSILVNNGSPNITVIDQTSISSGSVTPTPGSAESYSYTSGFVTIDNNSSESVLVNFLFEYEISADTSITSPSLESAFSVADVVITGDVIGPDFYIDFVTSDAGGGLTQYAGSVNFDLKVDADEIAEFMTLVGTSGHAEATIIPEPATMILFGLGLLGLAGVSRRKK